MDFIFIRGLRLEAQIGIYRRERTTTQPVEVDLEIALPGDRVFTTGKVSDTIDYARVAERLGQVAAATRFGLVEEMAHAFAGLILDEFAAPRVKVTISKLGILRETSRVGISIERSKTATPAGFNPNWQSSDSPSGSNPFADADTSP